jgi:hypothetical protein
MKNFIRASLALTLGGEPAAFGTQGFDITCLAEPGPGPLQRHERNVQRLEILEHRKQVPQVSSDPIQGPAHNHVEPRATCLEQ